MKKFTILSLLLLTFSIGFSQVVIRDTVVKWQHHRYELNSDYSVSSYSRSDNDIDTEELNSKVIENDLFKITIVPDFGGRIISYLYKPNGKEYLYTEKISTPYHIHWDTFYYRWLLLWGGIFPTFPEPEHGKAWCRPWEFSIIKQNSDTIAVRMSYTDSDEYSNHPDHYNNGQTDITCHVDISVFSGCNMFDFDVTLINNKNENVIYEYWTNTAFAPGCDPTNLKLSPNTEMVVPINTVDIEWNDVDDWAMGGSMPFENANYFNEWPGLGILYASEDPDDYWGIINHDNQNGMFRLADNTNKTPGVKFWTWGVDAIDTDPADWSAQGASSIIEIWAGVGKQFWIDETLAPNEIKSWKEQYFPTTGISKIDDINEFGAIDVKVNKEKEQTQLSINLMPTEPGKDFKVDVSLIGDTNYDLSIPEMQSANSLGNQINIDLTHTQYSEGEYQVDVSILDDLDEIQLFAQLSLNIPSNVGINKNILNELIKVCSIRENTITVTSEQMEEKIIRVYSCTGMLVSKIKEISKRSEIKVSNGGIYIVEVTNSIGTIAKKVFVR